MFNKKCPNPACGELHRIYPRGNLIYCRTCGETWDPSTLDYDTLYKERTKFLKSWHPEALDEEIHKTVTRDLNVMQGKSD